MSPITHYLTSWVLADQVLDNERDVNLVALSGIAPDLDSLGVVADLANSWLGRPETDYYASLHHWLLHGAAGALVISAALAAGAQRKAKVFFWSLLIFHIHLVCDVLGSRGPQDSGIWPLYYWGPFTDKNGIIVWADQWLLNGWQNISLTVALLAWTFFVMWRWDRSPFSLMAPKVHAALVATLRQRFGPAPQPQQGD